MADLIVDHENFEYAHSSLVTDLTALLAADRLHYLRFLELPGFDPQRAQFRLGKFRRLFAVVAQATDKPLRHHRAHRGSNEKRLNTDIDQTGDGRRSVVGVQCAENKVSRQAGIGRDTRGFEVANLANHNDVWRLAQNRAWSSCRSQSGL